MQANVKSAPNGHPATLRNRLPTLSEILARSTLPPVDLYCFYLFLQRENSEDSLDFWLDVAQHEQLCRAYFRDVRRSGRSVEQDWPEYVVRAKERGSAYGDLVGLGMDTPSAAATSQKFENDLPATAGSPGPTLKNLPHPSAVNRTTSPVPHTDPLRPESTQSNYQLNSPLTPTFTTPMLGSVPKKNSRAPTVLPRYSPTTRVDLRASAHRIFRRYLEPGADREIFLPVSLRMPQFSEVEADHPDMFASQKEYYYLQLQSSAYPRFLRSRVYGNLTPLGALARLGIGMFLLWFSLALGLSFIFLANHPRVIRLWIILPLSLAVLLLLSHQYDLDPILLLVFRKSETTPFRYITVKEPFVWRLLRTRAIVLMILTSIITAVMTVIFWAVPAHRL